MEKTIDLPCFGITVTLEGGHQGTITSELSDTEGEIDPDDILVMELNASINAIESMILAHAIAGIDITTPAYIEGIETAVMKCMEVYS
jgi:hypothetical protein